ncbi:MAG: DUF4293 domain-containing protein [Chitinophagales bacterium]
MIQRQQSLWLLLSTIGAFLSYKLPFFSGTQIKKEGLPPVPYDLDAGSNMFLLVFTGASIILSLVTIFLYKDRKLQLRLSLGGVALSLLILIIYFTQMKKFQTGSISLSCLLAFAVFAGYVMAARGIWKDQKLVKTLDRLR